MSRIEIDKSEFEDFIFKLKTAAQNDFREEMVRFLDGIGNEFLRIVCDEIIRKKVIDTSLLLNSFHKGDGNNVFVLSEGDLEIEVGTNLQYASYVNDGHWTCSKGEIGRWVPGQWADNRFIYDPSATSGMYLKQHWIEGRHYWDSALRILEQMLPELAEAKVQSWLDNYF